MKGKRLALTIVSLLSLVYLAGLVYYAGVRLIRWRRRVLCHCGKVGLARQDAVSGLLLSTGATAALPLQLDLGNLPRLLARYATVIRSLRRHRRFFVGVSRCSP